MNAPASTEDLSVASQGPVRERTGKTIRCQMSASELERAEQKPFCPAGPFGGRTENPGADGVERILRAYIRENCLPQQECATCDSEQNLFDSGVIDSAGLITFVAYIEQKFGIQIPDEDLLPENFMSISAMANYVRQRARPLE